MSSAFRDNPVSARRGEIIFHLGPPKTGSSSLQHLFDELQEMLPGEVVYLGIRHPRKTYQDVVDPRVFAPVERAYLLDSGQENGVLVKQGIPRELSPCMSQLSTAGITTVISEEMYLIEHPTNVSWERKLTAFWQNLQGLEVTPMIVLRKPQEAVESLFRHLKESQIQQVMRLRYRIFPFFFWFSGEVKSYDYVALITHLTKLGAKNIRILDLDDFRGNLSPRKIIGRGGEEFLAVPTLNSSETRLTRYEAWCLRLPTKIKERINNGYESVREFISKSEDRLYSLEALRDFLNSRHSVEW